MLVIGRRPGQAIVIGDSITVTVTGVDGGKIRLGIEAPQSVPIRRGELMPRPSGEDDLGVGETPTHA